MQAHVMELPRVIQIGYGVIKEIGRFLSRFPSRRILVVSGANVWAMNGGMVREALKEEGFEYTLLHVNSPTKDEVERDEKAAKKWASAGGEP